MIGCRKHIEEQERADLLSRRSGAPDWQSEVGSGVRRHSCMEAMADVNRLPHRPETLYIYSGWRTHTHLKF